MINGFYTQKDRVEMGLSLGPVNVGIFKMLFQRLKKNSLSHLIILKKGTTKMLFLRVTYLSSYIRGKERRKTS